MKLSSYAKSHPKLSSYRCNDNKPKRLSHIATKLNFRCLKIGERWIQHIDFSPQLYVSARWKNFPETYAEIYMQYDSNRCKLSFSHKKSIFTKQKMSDFGRAIPLSLKAEWKK